MPPAFNLSQDQTLQFNLCSAITCRSTSVDKSTSAFQLVFAGTSDNSKLMAHPRLSHVLTELSSRNSVAKSVRLPGSAHTYRLFKFLKSCPVTRLLCSPCATGGTDYTDAKADVKHSAKLSSFRLDGTAWHQLRRARPGRNGAYPPGESRWCRAAAAGLCRRPWPRPRARPPHRWRAAPQRCWRSTQSVAAPG